MTDRSCIDQKHLVLQCDCYSPEDLIVIDFDEEDQQYYIYFQSANLASFSDVISACFDFIIHPFSVQDNVTDLKEIWKQWKDSSCYHFNEILLNEIEYQKLQEFIEKCNHNHDQEKIFDETDFNLKIPPPNFYIDDID